MDYNKQYCTATYNVENEDSQVCEVEVGNCEKGSDELLIDAIRCYPHLYNSALKEYKDSQMKENSWIEISKVMDMSVVVCQNRWIRLRDRFSKEKRLRETETRSGSGASHRSGFPLYNSMLFMENHIKRRKSYTNVIHAPKKKCLTDTSNTCHNINISTSNISSSHQTIPSIDSNNYPNLFSVPFTHSKESIAHRTENVIQSDRLLLPSQCETCLSDTNESSDSVPRDSVSRNTVSRDSVPRDSISSDSVSKESLSRDSTPSPASQTLPFNMKTDFSKRLRNNSNTYLEHSLISLIDSLHKRVTTTNQPSHGTSWILTPDKSFGVLVAMEMEKISEPEKSKRKQAITEILFKPLHASDHLPAQ